MRTGTLRREALNLIGGEWRPAIDGHTFQSMDPHDGSLVAEVASGTAEDADRAVAAARAAFDDGPWPRMRPSERAAILHAIADALEANLDELAELETRDSGKPIRETVNADIPRSALNLRFFADYAALAGNEAYPTVSACHTRSRRPRASFRRSARGTLRSCWRRGRSRRPWRSETPWSTSPRPRLRLRLCGSLSLLCRRAFPRACSTSCTAMDAVVSVRHSRGIRESTGSPSRDRAPPAPSLPPLRPPT